LKDWLKGGGGTGFAEAAISISSLF
jgi:hypothetical protein